MEAATCDMLMSCGFNKPLVKLVLSDIPAIESCVVLHSTLISVKAELDDIVKGLDDAGVLGAIRESPFLFRPLFVYQDVPLKAGNVGLSSEADEFYL